MFGLHSDFVADLTYRLVRTPSSWSVSTMDGTGETPRPTDPNAGGSAAVHAGVDRPEEGTTLEEERHPDFTGVDYVPFDVLK